LIVLGVALSLIVGYALMMIFDPQKQSRSSPESSPQFLETVDAGIRATITRATFSGTATFVEMQFDVVDTMKYPGARSVELRRTDFDVERGAIAPSVESFTAPLGSALPMRMDPVVGDRATVTFRALTVVQADGSRIDVPGTWQLNLSLPENIDSLRRVERLSTPVLSESGVTVAVEGAVRSVNETVVTVRFDAAEDVRQVGQPWIEGDDGERLFGAPVQRSGAVETYAFPFTDWGSELRVHFGPFLGAGEALAGTVRLDLGRVIEREGLTGADRETATLFADDSVAFGDLPAADSVRFTGVFQSTGRQEDRAVWISFPGVFDTPGDQPGFEATDAFGDPITVAATRVSLGQSITGSVGTPRTMVLLPFQSLDQLDGVVTIVYAGDPDRLIRGDWDLRLVP
jgi:hypothetical protein